ncbi:MAG: hypothetical protein R2726_03155 [Acidimicrobiales bacterium]
MAARVSVPARPGARLYAGYLGLQAVLGVALWVSIATSSTVRSAFELTPERSWVTDAFVYPDLLVTVIGSGLSAWGVGAAKRWAVPVVAFTAGSVVYPTIYLFAWVGNQGVGSVALWVMVVVSTLTSWVAWQTYRAWR